MHKDQARLRAEIDYEFHMAEAFDRLAVVYQHTVEAPLDKVHHVNAAKNMADRHRRTMDTLAKRYRRLYTTAGKLARAAERAAAWFRARADR